MTDALKVGFPLFIEIGLIIPGKSPQDIPTIQDRYLVLEIWIGRGKKQLLFWRGQEKLKG